MKRIVLYSSVLLCVVSFYLYAKGQHAVSDHLMAKISQSVLEKQLDSKPYTIISHWNKEGMWVADTVLNSTPECLFNCRNAAKIGRTISISSTDTLFLLEASSADYSAYVFNRMNAFFIQKVDTIVQDTISHYYLIQPSKIQNEYKKLYRHIIDWDTTSLGSFKYNPMVLGEFYNWYLTRVCIAQGHVCNVDFSILPDQDFWNPE